MMTSGAQQTGGPIIVKQEADDQAVTSMTYEDLLAQARRARMLGLESQIVQVPAAGNEYVAVVLATAQTERGAFRAIGEARIDAVPPSWRPFLLTLADTRAKARAMRELLAVVAIADQQGATGMATPGNRATGVGPLGQGFPQAGSGASFAPTRAEMTPATVVAPAADLLNHPAFEAEETPDGADIDGDDGGLTGSPLGYGPAHIGPSSTHGLPVVTDPVGRETISTMLRLTSALAELEGIEYTEGEARAKLNAFFVKAFGHSLERATRLEGQRVLQRLSADYARLQNGQEHDTQAERVGFRRSMAVS